MRRPYCILVLAVSVLSVLSACADTDDGSDSTGVEYSVDSTGSYPVTQNAGQAPQWSIELIGSVGSSAVTGTPAPDEFGRVSSVTTGPDETVWVADQFAHQISVFRPDGSLQLEFGGEGQGPGEYIAINSIAWAGNRLLVLDFGNGRVAELASDGTWLGTRSAPGRVSGPGTMLRFYPISDNSVFQWSLEPVAGEVRRVWVEHGPEGVVATWPQLQPEPPEPTSVVCNRPDGGISFFSVPFGGQVLHHPFGDGESYMVWTAAYRIASVDSANDTLRVIERQWPSVPLSDEDWERETAEFAAFGEEWPGAECTPRSMRRPSTRAPITNLLVGTDGRLWVEAVTERGSAWEIFDPDGRLVGSLPGFEYDRSVVPSIRDDRLAWVHTDSMDVQYVSWGRVTGPSSF